MQGNKAKTIAELREKVAAYETKPVLADHETETAAPSLLATPRGYVHEIFADTLVNTGAAFGFALAQSRTMLSAERPGLLILGLKSETQELGLPYALGFRTFGLEATAFVMIRTDTITELLWAMEEAIACRCGMVLGQ